MQESLHEIEQFYHIFRAIKFESVWKWMMSLVFCVQCVQFLSNDKYCVHINHFFLPFLFSRPSWIIILVIIHWNCIHWDQNTPFCCCSSFYFVLPWHDVTRRFGNIHACNILNCVSVLSFWFHANSMRFALFDICMDDSDVQNREVSVCFAAGNRLAEIQTIMHFHWHFFLSFGRR